MTAEELGAVIGKRALAIVQECSDDKSLDKVKRKQLQLEHAAHASLAAKCVKISDKMSNVADLLRDPPISWSNHELRGYMWWSLAVVRKCGRVHPLYDEMIDLLAKNGIVFATEDSLQQHLNVYYSLIDKSE